MAVTESGKPFAELTGFKARILAILAREGPTYGLGIKSAYEDEFGVEVNHGRLYPNLDDLKNAGLIEKSELDKRTNEYAITKKGRNVVRSQFVWLNGCLEDSDE